MFCPKCRVQLVSDTTPFCVQCGAPVKASAQAPVQAASGVQSTFSVAVPGSRKAPTKLWLWGALTVLAILGLVVFRFALHFGLGGEVKGIWATDSDVNIVRNGVLKAHNSTTVGKAFEGTFQKAKWSSFGTPKGETVVQFDGTVLFDRKLCDDLLNRGGMPISWQFATANKVVNKMGECKSAVPVKFQFTLAVDHKAFQISYVDDAFDNDPDSALSFIYQ